MTGIFHFLSRSQSSCKTVHPPDTIVLWGSLHLPSSPKMILPPQLRWPTWEWRSHPHSPSRYLRQQENHPAEPCSDAESWEIITGCSKPLSFGVICYIATDNQNIFPHAFLHNHCSLKRKKTLQYSSVSTSAWLLQISPGFHLRCQPNWSSRCFLTCLSQVLPFLWFYHFTNPVWRLNCISLSSIATTSLLEFSTLEGLVQEWHSLLHDLCPLNSGIIHWKVSASLCYYLHFKGSFVSLYIISSFEGRDWAYTYLCYNI